MSRRIAGIKVKVEVKEGRVKVSGREYFADHVYSIGFEALSFSLSREGTIIELNYKGLPAVITEEGSLIKIGGRADRIIIEESSVINVVKDNDNVKAVISNIDIKVRTDNNNGVEVLIEKFGRHTARKVEIYAEGGLESIANILTRPFFSAWIYCRGLFTILMNKEKGKDVLKIAIKRRI